MINLFGPFLLAAFRERSLLVLLAFEILTRNLEDSDEFRPDL